jgi:hypothetical protein
VKTWKFERQVIYETVVEAPDRVAAFIKAGEAPDCEWSEVDNSMCCLGEIGEEVK